MTTHDVTFRLPDMMLRALVALAEDKGVSVGDLLREAVSRDLRLRGALAAPGLAPPSLLMRVRPAPVTALRAD